MNKKNNNLMTLSEFKDKHYGKRGALKREELEAGYNQFKLGALIHEARLEKGMMQEQHAEKCGTTKSYISRIENNASDIRLSTLMRIVKEGLGGHLKLSVAY